MPRRPGRRSPFGVVLAVAAIAALGIMLYVGGRQDVGGSVRGPAPAFTLVSTSGASVSLSDYRGRNVLLYFNEGVGCDACFYQMVELEKHADRFEAVGIDLVPVVANPVEAVELELQRFGLSTPYLIDEGTAISAAYGMLGKGMHANLPGHGFVLVDAAGQVRWSREYPSMFISADDLLAALPDLA